MKVYRMLILAVMALLPTAGAAADGREIVEAVLIRVNDRIVTMSDFDKRLQVELAQRPEELDRAEMREFVKQLYGSVLEEQILLERAESRDLTVDERELDQAIQGLREQNALQTDEAFEQALEQSGMTMEELRERYRQSMLLQRAVRSDVRSIEVTEEEIRRQYERNKDQYKVPEKLELEQVFLPAPEGGPDRDAVRRRLLGLLSRVREGADLRAEVTLAGGEISDLGKIPAQDLRPVVADAVADLEPGELSEPIETPDGFQLLKLVQRHPAGYLTFEEVKEPLRRRLSRQRFQEQTAGMVETLRGEYLVETNPELLNLIVPGSWDE